MGLSNGRADRIVSIDGPDLKPTVRNKDNPHSRCGNFLSMSPNWHYALDKS